MDTPVERKPGINRKHLYTIGGVALGIAVILYFIFRDTASSMTVEKDRLTIATVKQAEFNDYIRVIGQVMPNRIIYMDAIEGGRVEERLKEEGAMVKAGDVILRLSNPLLNIGIMQSEADLAYQENELRNTRISMEQERLQLKQERIGLNKELTLKKRRYEQYRRLVEEQLIAREDFRQAEEEYEAAKERLVYFDARTKIHLQNYLEGRSDENPALFVSLKSPFDRLMIGGVETRLRELGKRLNIPKVHPHKFRRTLATTAIDKGMPIEQVQQLLGHQKIDTTMHYAMVKQQNVKLAHRKYIG